MCILHLQSWSQNSQCQWWSGSGVRKIHGWANCQSCQKGDSTPFNWRLWASFKSCPDLQKPPLIWHLQSSQGCYWQCVARAVYFHQDLCAGLVWPEMTLNPHMPKAALPACQLCNSPRMGSIADNAQADQTLRRQQMLLTSMEVKYDVDIGEPNNCEGVSAFFCHDAQILQ